MIWQTPPAPIPSPDCPTRITCAATSDAPTNLDATVVFGWFGVKSLQEYPSTKDCFAIQSLDELTDPRVIALAWQCSPYYHVSADDVPVYLSHTRAKNRSPNAPAPTRGCITPSSA